MKEESDPKKFYENLIKFSVSKTKKAALTEWEHISSYYDFKATHCICGKCIKERCLIKNKLNNNSLIIGNVCINKFFKINLNFYFSGLARCRDLKIPNKSFIDLAYANKFISDYEHKFLKNTFRKKLTLKQKQFKLKLIKKMKKFNLNNLV